MGQAQSEMAATAAAPVVDHTQGLRSAAAAAPSSSSFVTPHDSQPASSLESRIAEAAAYGDDGNGSRDAKAQKALECPCIAELRNGSCGVLFSEAFLCFLKSTAEEKGSDCVHPFVALQNCIKANPEAFSKDILEENVKKEEEPAHEYRIIPPEWSRESPSPKSKL